MTDRYAQIAFSPKVQEHQRRQGSYRAYRNRTEGPLAEAEYIGPSEREFIAARDSFYLASIGESGWPYIQHRGGSAGFLHVLDEQTLAFPDFRGNRQYISRGNIDHDDRVALFLMDYAHRTRVKIFGRASAVEDSADPALIERLMPEGYRARAERAVLIRVEALEWNCPQHIPQLFPAEDVREALGAMQEKIDRLEKENSELRAAAAGDAAVGRGTRTPKGLSGPRSSGHPCRP